MANNKKQKLFEMMKKINSNFKLNEVVAQQRTTSADVANLQKATQKSSTIQQANSRIDTPQEFQEGFKTWFATTGFNPQKKPLSISQAQTLIKNAMIELGYK